MRCSACAGLDLVVFVGGGGGPGAVVTLQRECTRASAWDGCLFSTTFFFVPSLSSLLSFPSPTPARVLPRGAAGAQWRERPWNPFLFSWGREKVCLRTAFLLKGKEKEFTNRRRHQRDRPHRQHPPPPPPPSSSPPSSLRLQRGQRRRRRRRRRHRRRRHRRRRR